MSLRVYTGGSFDLFHWAHAEFLKRCKTLAGENGEVIVSLNTDEFIKAYKGKGLVMTYEERRKALLSCRYVDDVVANLGGADSKLAIELVRPDLIVIGSDWARRDYYAQMQFDQDWLDERGIGLCYIPYTQGISSTDIKARLRFSGKLET
jgi:glycerol-3-phosphate cytidylyltransferase